MSSSSSSSPGVPCIDEQQEPFSYKHATHDEILEELESRFLLNLPDEELASLDRICFQIEQAHWFYEDFVREQNSKLPSYPLKKFSAMMFVYSDLLRHWGDDHERIFNTFMQYKTRVPVCGAIMLNDTWDKCVLVKGWKSSSGWGFPKGKINEDEPPTTCAIREVLEETGYNLAGQIDPENLIEMSIRDQKIALYVVPGVPEDFPFKTKTRKEISRIEWFKLADLPTWKRNKGSPGKFYLITPFITPLKAFIHDRKPRGPSRKASRPNKPIKNNVHREQVHVSTVAPLPDPSQESSSQSSADPHTPSPHCVQQVPIVHDAASGLDTDTMDPHFARLLSSLTLSGAAALRSGSNDQTKLSKSHSDFISNKTITSGSNQERKDHAHSLSPVENVNGHRNNKEQPSSAPPKTITPLLYKSSAPLSPTSPSRTSRRTSSTADISPYLSKATDVQLSARRLKQLALLEAVADESARMSPSLTSRPLADDHLQYPTPSSFPFNGSDSSLLYSTSSMTATPLTRNLPPLMPASQPQAIYDPFQVRSRTSHALQRPNYPSSGSMSMSQGQLLALMTPHTPAAPTRPPIPSFQPPSQPTPFMAQQPTAPLQFSQGSLPAMSNAFQPSPQWYQVPPSRPNPANNTLLSILNGAAPSGSA